MNIQRDLNGYRVFDLRGGGQLLWAEKENVWLWPSGKEIKNNVDDELDRLRKEIEDKESLAEKRMLESQDWEDEYHALKRRYEELDKSALEKHELLMDTTAKFRAVSKELEKNRDNMRHCKSSLRAAKQLSKEIDHTGAPKDMQTFRVFAKNMKIHMALVDWDLINSLAVGQEGEGNQ